MLPIWDDSNDRQYSRYFSEPEQHHCTRCGLAVDEPGLCEVCLGEDEVKISGKERIVAAFGMVKCKLCGHWKFGDEINQMQECFDCLIGNGTIGGWPCPDCEGGAIPLFTGGPECKTCKGKGMVPKESLKPRS